MNQCTIMNDNICKIILSLKPLSIVSDYFEALTESTINFIPKSQE